MRDLSVMLKKTMIVSPLVMFRTKISRHKFVPTKTILTWISWFIYTFNNIAYFFRRVWRKFFSIVPSIAVIFFHMFRIIFKEFKIFYFIIGFYFIYMMDTFIFFKFSSKILFHNISMLKNSFSIYIYTKITKFSERWLSFFEIKPIWRYIIIIFIKGKECQVIR